MPWVSGVLQGIRDGAASSGVLQGVRARGTGITARVREHARDIAAKTQELEEAVVKKLARPVSAKEQEAKLEAEAKKLIAPGVATDAILRWLECARSTSTRYPEIPQAPAGGSADAVWAAGGRPELTFQQVFSRSRALEILVDTAARTPKLRQALRERALPPPKEWPEEKSPESAFAQAFVLLLQAIVGPPELWLGPLGALLASEKVVDEQCHTWLVQLIAGQRLGSDEAALLGQVREVETAEDAAQQCFDQVGPAPELAAGSGSLDTVLEHLVRRGPATEAAYQAWDLRNALANNLSQVVARREAWVEARREFLSKLADAASERATELESEAAAKRSNAEELSGELRRQLEVATSELDSLAPTARQVQQEIEDTERSQKELLLQVGQLSEKLDVLRTRRAEGAKREEALQGERKRCEDQLAARLLAEDEACQQTDSLQALVRTVVDLAVNLAAPADGDRRSVKFAETAEQSRALADDAALRLAEREVERLKIAASAVEMCAEVVEERERSRAAMEEAGVPLMTLESDVVGEAEIAQSFDTAIAEVDRCRADVEWLCRELTRAVGRPRAGAAVAAEAASSSACAAEGSEAASRERAASAGAWAATLRLCLEECDLRRARLVDLVPQPEEEEAPSTASTTAGSEGSAQPVEGDPFLLLGADVAFRGSQELSVFEPPPGAAASASDVRAAAAAPTD